MKAADQTGSLMMHYNDLLKLCPLFIILGLHYLHLDRFLWEEWFLPFLGTVSCWGFYFLVLSLLVSGLFIFLATLQSPVMYPLFFEIPYFLLMETKIFTLQKEKKNLRDKILRKTTNNSKIHDKVMKAGYNKSQWDVIQYRLLWPHACLNQIQFAIQIICCGIKLQAIACLYKRQPSHISFLMKVDGFKHSLFTSNFVILYFSFCFT